MRRQHAALGDGRQGYPGSGVGRCGAGIDGSAASAAQKDAALALVMATRLIDASVQFNGRKASDCQALQWPRAGCPDVDSPSHGLVLRFLGSVTAGCIEPTVGCILAM